MAILKMSADGNIISRGGTNTQTATFNIDWVDFQFYRYEIKAYADNDILAEMTGVFNKYSTEVDEISIEEISYTLSGNALTATSSIDRLIIVDMVGRMVYDAPINAGETIYLNQGLYAIRGGNQMRKVMIK